MEFITNTKDLRDEENASSDNKPALGPRDEPCCEEELVNKIISEICRVSIAQKVDHFDSKDFFRECIMDNLGIELRQFDDCLEILDTKGYLKITHHYRQYADGDFAVPLMFQVMEEGKKYYNILQEKSQRTA